MTPNNFRVKSGLTVGTTISGGNTTITGFVNATSSVNAASFTVGATVVANSTGVFATHLNGAAASGYQTTDGLSANVATLTSNNSTYAFSKSEADLNVNNSTRATAANTVSVTSQSSNSTTFYPVFVTGTSTGTALGLDSALTYVPSTDTLTLGNITVSGNLTVSGTRTYVNTTTLDVGDNIITLNADLGASAPSENAGIEIMRGTSANVQFVWDETNDRWSTNAAPLAVGNTTIAGFANVDGNITSRNLLLQGDNTNAYIRPSNSPSNLYLGANGTNYVTIFSNGNFNVGSSLTVAGISTLSANLVMANNNITRPVLTGYTEHEVANAAVTGSYTMDCGAANFFDLTLTGNTTISPSNVPPSTRVWSGSIAAKQDATGGRTITWPAGTKYAGGVAPPATTTANALDIWSLMTYDGGTSWIVSLSVKGVA